MGCNSTKQVAGMSPKAIDCQGNTLLVARHAAGAKSIAKWAHAHQVGNIVGLDLQIKSHELISELNGLLGACELGVQTISVKELWNLYHIAHDVATRADQGSIQLSDAKVRINAIVKQGKQHLEVPNATSGLSPVPVEHDSASIGTIVQSAAHEAGDPSKTYFLGKLQATATTRKKSNAVRTRQWPLELCCNPLQYQSNADVNEIAGERALPYNNAQAKSAEDPFLFTGLPSRSVS